MLLFVRGVSCGTAKIRVDSGCIGPVISFKSIEVIEVLSDSLRNEKSKRYL